MPLSSMISASLLMFAAQSPALQSYRELGEAIQSREIQGLEHQPANTGFIGGFATPGGTERDVVEFYHYPKAHGASFPIARRARETAGGQGEAQWADGRTCPGLYSVMAAQERISPPLFFVPPLTEPAPTSVPPSAPITVHGSLVSVWGYARQADGAPMFMTLSGSSGLIDAWVRWAERQLHDCWSSAEPPKSDEAKN